MTDTKIILDADVFRRFTEAQYDAAIEALQSGKKQLEPNGHGCPVCGDSGHCAWQCGHNPLVAMSMCEQIAKSSKELHETLHYLAGEDRWMGHGRGPAIVVPIPPDPEKWKPEPEPGEPLKLTGLDVLRSLSPEDLARVEKLTDEQIREALAKGYRDRQAAEHAQGSMQISTTRYK